MIFLQLELYLHQKLTLICSNLSLALPMQSNLINSTLLTTCNHCSIYNNKNAPRRSSSNCLQMVFLLLIKVSLLLIFAPFSPNQLHSKRICLQFDRTNYSSKCMLLPILLMLLSPSTRISGKLSFLRPSPSFLCLLQRTKIKKKSVLECWVKGPRQKKCHLMVII